MKLVELKKKNEWKMKSIQRKLIEEEWMKENRIEYQKMWKEKKKMNWQKANPNLKMSSMNFAVVFGYFHFVVLPQWNLLMMAVGKNQKWKKAKEKGKGKLDSE